MRYILIAAASVALATTAQAQTITRNPSEVRAGTYVLDPAHGKITWSLSHLGFSTYVGQFSDVSATLKLDPRKATDSQLEATVQTASAGTLNAMLDKHLQSADFFDVANHPTATFRASQIKLVDQDTAEVTGALTLRGVTRTITMIADFNQAGTSPVDGKYTLGFDGRAVIKRSDYGINYALPVLGDEVTLHFEAEFKLQDAPKVGK